MSGKAPRIRVVLADDHAIVREGVRLCLQSMGDIDVVGEAEDGHEAIRLVEQLAPDVAVLDVSMPRLNGIEALRQLRRDHPHTASVLLSMHDNEAYVTQALRAGAAGYVLKRTAATELGRAIRAAHNGDIYLDPGIARRVVADYVQRLDGDDPERDASDRLTAREREVLQLAADGRTIKQIAQALVVSTKTAEHHRTAAMTKLGLRNQTQLVKYAIRTGLIEVDT